MTSLYNSINENMHHQMPESMAANVRGFQMIGEAVAAG